MSEILDLKTIHDYNEFLGLETLNPLVSFVDFSKVEVLKHRCKCFGFYAVFLKEKIHGQITYGRSKYDYQEGTLVFIAPGQVGVSTTGERLCIREVTPCSSILTLSGVLHLPER